MRHLAEAKRELRRKALDLTHAVAMRNRREHGLGVTGAEELDLPARHHVAEKVDVVGIELRELIEQRAADVHGEFERGVLGQRAQERRVAALVRVPDHLGEVSGRLVRVHAEEQGNGVGHRNGYAARRIAPSDTAVALPALTGCARAAGGGAPIISYKRVRLARYSASKRATAAAGL